MWSEGGDVPETCWRQVEEGKWAEDCGRCEELSRMRKDSALACTLYADSAHGPRFAHPSWPSPRPTLYPVPRYQARARRANRVTARETRAQSDRAGGPSELTSRFRKFVATVRFDRMPGQRALVGVKSANCPRLSERGISSEGGVETREPSLPRATQNARNTRRKVSPKMRHHNSGSKAHRVPK